MPPQHAERPAATKPTRRPLLVEAIEGPHPVAEIHDGEHARGSVKARLKCRVVRVVVHALSRQSQGIGRGEPAAFLPRHACRWSNQKNLAHDSRTSKAAQAQRLKGIGSMAGPAWRRRRSENIVNIRNYPHGSPKPTLPLASSWREAVEIW